MTTTITENVTDIEGMDDSTAWVFFSQYIRESDGVVISTKKVRKYPIAGVLTVELEPGPAVVIAADGKTYPFTVPDTDSELWPLIQAAVIIPPSTKHQELVDAVEAWLDGHTELLNASALVPTAVKTSGYTAAANDLVPCNATSGGFTVTLPTAPADKSVIEVKKLDAVPANAVTVQRGGSDVFNTTGGPTSIQLTLQGESVWLQYKASGAIWFVVAHGVPVSSLKAYYDTLYLGVDDIPAVDQLLDSSGNHVLITRGSGFIDLATTGSDTNIDWYTELKGNAKWRLWMQDITKPATIRADGTASTVNLNLESKNGAVNLDGVPGVTRDVATTASSSTPTVAITASRMQYTVTALAANATFGAPTGSPGDGWTLMIRVKDNGTARTLAYNAIFRAIGVTLPTTTVLGKTLYLGCVFNSADTKWDVLAVGQQA